MLCIFLNYVTHNADLLIIELKRFEGEWQSDGMWKLQMTFGEQLQNYVYV